MVSRALGAERGWTRVHCAVFVNPVPQGLSPVDPASFFSLIFFLMPCCRMVWDSFYAIPLVSVSRPLGGMTRWIRGPRTGPGEPVPQ